MSLGALAFLNPWLLAALAALPVIYWLLRTVPPRPRQVPFPATRILVGLENKERTPDKTPWWLMLIRMLAAALVILALAEPVLNPNTARSLDGNGPVVAVVDNGWSSASRWGARLETLGRIIDEAEAARRSVVLVPTAGRIPAGSVRIEAPADARARVAAMVPEPFAPDHGAALDLLRPLVAGQSGLSIVWLADGIDHGASETFVASLSELAPRIALIEPGRGDEPLAVRARIGRDGALEGEVIRAAGGPREGILHALSARGERLAEARFAFAPDAVTTSASFALPLELRNQVTRVIVASERSAGAVHLLDARSQWHRVGLLAGSSQEQAQPLLGPLYYIRRALEPFSELVVPDDANLEEGIKRILDQNATVAMLADIGTLPDHAQERLAGWIDRGGVLVRFAGPRLEQGGDALLPVELRLGGRTLGGALSWSTPQKLAGFGDDSLFAGLEVPADVLVNRQVLADPASIDRDVSVWARLEDGTPLVTARRRGEGQVVLFHVTANSDWSNLPLSGLFVEMLRRISTLGKQSTVKQSDREATVTAETEARDASDVGGNENVLAPLQVLDGYGELEPPPPTAKAVPLSRLETLTPGPEHPPGYYGAQGMTRALNLIGPETTLAPLPSLSATVDRRAYEGQSSTPLKPWMLSSALALLLIDVLAVLALQGAFLALFAPRRRPAVARSAIITIAAVTALAALALPSGDATAQSAARPIPGNALPADQRLALEATSVVTLGYVITGDNGIDGTSRAGLKGLGRTLAMRTAVEPGEPLAVDIEFDEIAFFPVLYWPVLSDAKALSDETLAKIDAYMKRGGMIIFDTRDFGQGLPIELGARREGTALQRLIGKLDLPRLEPVPEGHVLTKSFYLLRSFPGRWDGGQLWVEADATATSEAGRQARRADGVSSILVSSNDFAAAWAADDDGRPLFPVVPGGEQQREYAYRTGVNIVMYALTGNYKADQVHVPALLQRLGQ